MGQIRGDSLGSFDPLQEQLAFMAAAFHYKAPVEAVRFASQVWKEAERFLANVQQETSDEALLAEKMPSKFPAKFTTFCALVMKIKHSTDRTRLLRETI